VFPGLMVSLQDFLNSGGNSNNEVGGPFCHLGYFLSFRALMRNLLDCTTFCYPYKCSPPTMLSPTNVWQPLRVGRQHPAPPS
jgi:hypothetical protein